MSDAMPAGVLCVRDNGGRTIDRYTVVLDSGTNEGTLDVLGLSSHPTSPQGFSQWGEGVDGDHLGRTVGWGDLPPNVRAHAAARLSE